MSAPQDIAVRGKRLVYFGKVYEGKIHGSQITR
jgi:hypothetical protein